ncbi:MAG: BtpA/SgcQ family protein [Candidatus Woesebacteria bacterium]|nr:BtpA/SgcQ family protein [Candidatus Woesebacteria bacterium]
MKEYLPVEEISESQAKFYSKWVAEHKDLASEEKDTNKIFDEVFGKDIVAIAGLRLLPAIGFERHPSFEHVAQNLKENLVKLRETGIDGVVLESYMDRPHRIFYDDKNLLDYYFNLALIAKKESEGKFRVGINLILFDIYGALTIAKSASLDFVAVDEFVDPIECSKEEANFDHSFIFKPNPALVKDFQRNIDAKNIIILAGSNSNYYPLVNPTNFEASAQKANLNSAAAVVLGKDNAHLHGSNNKFNIPILVSGGIKCEDIEWIKKDNFRGFLAGSMFEEKLGVIDAKKVIDVLKVLK